MKSIPWIDPHTKLDITVKPGYNDHGYNEFTIITNKWQIVKEIFSVITNDGHNEQFLLVPESMLKPSLTAYSEDCDTKLEMVTL